MAVRKRRKVYLNSENAASVANRDNNAAFTQSHGQLEKRTADGRFSKDWHEGKGYTRSATGRLSTNGRTAGGSTYTFTPKNDDGSPVLGKNGKPRQSGRSGLATRRQRYYDVRVGLGLAGG